MKVNFLVLAISALVPLIVGSAWYSPLLFAKAWTSSIGMTEEQGRKGNMVVSMIVLYIVSFFLAFGLEFMVIHQWHMSSILLNQPGFADKTGPTWEMYNNFMASYGHEFRRYRHGALHGAIGAVEFALPIIASSAVFEQRGWKYIGITFGFWFINFTLMGAIICHWGTL